MRSCRVADFPGDRNWGYDGVALYAPARCYGTPDDLRALIDTAHRHGLAVILEVVYNHLGPDGAYANAFSPHYFTDAHESPWGRGVNRRCAQRGGPARLHRQRAALGGRLSRGRPAAGCHHALVDEGARHFLAELTTTVRAHADKRIYLVAEDHRYLATLLRPPHEGGYGLDGVWADDFHHQVRVHTARASHGSAGAPERWRSICRRSWHACLTTEDVGTSEHRLPITIHRVRSYSVVRFSRPGAVVFRITE